MRSLCVAVPRNDAERVRQALLKEGQLRTGLVIGREGDTVFLPTTGRDVMGYSVSEREFQEAFVPIRSYKDIVEVPAELRPKLPTSFDVVGDIALIRISEDLAEHGAAIGDAILRANPRVHVVAADTGVKGPLRIRSLRILAGPARTETTHKEHGLVYRVDVAKAYFSPRLASERDRVASQVQPGEAVADLFAGVGPYAILIARRRQPRVVYAFDANPDAYVRLEENVRRNRAHRVEPRGGDALELVNDIEPLDRAIIDYPQDPDPAYRALLRRILPNGILHYYVILETAERADREKAIRATAEALDRDAKVLRVHEVHGWSPTQKLFAFDIRVI